MWWTFLVAALPWFPPIYETISILISGFCGGAWKQRQYNISFFSSHKDDTITNSLGLYMYVGKKFYLIDGNVAMDPKDQEAEDLEAVEKVAH